MISYSSLVKIGVASVRGEASGRFHDLPPRIFVPAIFPFLTISPYRGENQYASHLVHWEGDMHRTLCTGFSVWSSFDHLWAVFSGELLGDDVINWPCSFRQWSNTFRDLRALSLWTFLIGVEVPKNVYNSCPLKHEVVNILMSGEMLYYEDPKFFRVGRWLVIRYNTINCFDNIFSWSSWGGHSHAQLYKFIFMYIG